MSAPKRMQSSPRLVAAKSSPRPVATKARPKPVATKSRPKPVATKTGQKPGRPKGASSEETHTRIVVAARRVFAEHGYANAQNRKIAEGAGVTTSTLYHYFQSKLDLYVSVYRASERELGETYAAASSHEGLAAQLDAIFAGSLALHERDPNLLVFLAGTAREMRSHPTLARAIAKCPVHTDRILRETLGRAVRKGELPKSTDVDAVVSLVFALTSGVSLYSSFLGDRSYPRMVGALRELVNARLSFASK